ncbi:hypothetical protein BD626DRAFT_631853 [Schizophyllum amplum]|uniref:Uncharacterized protein n=1 Tax=Schizophyllum amplum TaxID=97359 RepID=A0A550C942_9AGAR|nr:hypothetical protein BD626DRAFT_631853 [Auriculariopsis ampla]
MLKYKMHPHDRKCVMSGATIQLARARLIPEEAADEEEHEVATKEWMFGLPRGDLRFYLASPANGMILRHDICNMYCHGEFVLVPTFKTYLDIMKFMRGINNRKDDDRSPRRPLTVLASPNGFYRYVFIAYSKAARALQEQLKLQAQTDEDMNGGIHPLDGNPCVPGSNLLPILECYPHPFSISVYADKAFSMRRRTPITDQWYTLTRRILEHWEQQLIQPPQWFIDEPKLGEDDDELSATEASGYWLHSSADKGTAKAWAGNGVMVHVDDYKEHCWKRIDLWVNSVDPDASDPDAPLPSIKDPNTTHLHTNTFQRSPLQLRRSHRIRAKACPYARPSPDHRTSPRATAQCPPYAPPSPDSGPRTLPPSPPRKAAYALRYRDVVRDPPAWAKRDGEFPTPTFSSNDWAYFCHRIALNAPPA